MPYSSTDACAILSQVGQPECATGDTASSTTVALIGDSNAAMWSPAFQQVAEQRHWRLETLTKVGCPLLDLPITNPILGREYTECEHWRGQILARLQAEHPRLVVLSMMRRYGAARMGFRFHVLRPGMDRQPDPPRARSCAAPAPTSWCSGRSRIRTHRCRLACPATSTTRRPARRRGRPRSNEPGIAAEAAATSSRRRTIRRPHRPVLHRRALPGHRRQHTGQFDENHVTFEYARLLAPVIGALADRALVHG